MRIDGKDYEVFGGKKKGFASAYDRLGCRLFGHRWMELDWGRLGGGDKYCERCGAHARLLMRGCRCVLIPMVKP